MMVMFPKMVVEVLGAFGDGRWYMKENSFPMIHYLNRKKYTHPVINEIVHRYTMYRLLEKKTGGSLPGEIKGHPYFRITEKGIKALDWYRNCIMRSLDRDPDKLAGKTALTI